WPQGQVRGNWGPGPIVGPRFTSGQGRFGGLNRPAFGNRGFGGGGMHFGNMRPMHAGR
ncbi:SH3 domain-containing protein, partial [Salmonella enterica subsp. enterica serovar Alachua]|nr:SH3 domain-containing protein [Salmonella enterica subsp. enterica serovar Alachua]